MGQALTGEPLPNRVDVLRFVVNRSRCPTYRVIDSLARDGVPAARGYFMIDSLLADDLLAFSAPHLFPTEKGIERVREMDAKEERDG